MASENQLIDLPLMPDSKDVFHNRYGEMSKLTDLNYASWSTNARSMLMAAEAWDIVTQEEDSPVAPNANASAVTRAEYRQARSSYNKRLGQAVTIIRQSCSPAIQGHLSGLYDPAIMWTTLKNTIDIASKRAGPGMLREKLYNTRFDGTSSITPYIAKILAIRDQLAETDNAMTNQEVLNHLCAILPKS